MSGLSRECRNCAFVQVGLQRPSSHQHCRKNYVTSDMKQDGRALLQVEADDVCSWWRPYTEKQEEPDNGPPTDRRKGLERRIEKLEKAFEAEVFFTARKRGDIIERMNRKERGPCD